MKQLSKFFADHSYRNAYILVGLVAVVSYYFMRQLFIDQTAWSFIKTSQLTFNIIILFGLWGGFHHLIIKVKNPYLDKVILVAGFVLIVLVLRLAGMKTIFG